MVKLKPDPITEADLVEYLDSSSDFAFELRCLERITALGWECQHGGSYVDPVTGKTRQFDLRARRRVELHSHRCAIECKNLAKNFPLLVLAVPRAADESFHEVILSYPAGLMGGERPYQAPAFQDVCMALRAPEAVYRTGDPVGKSCAQVGRSAMHQRHARFY